MTSYSSLISSYQADFKLVITGTHYFIFKDQNYWQNFIIDFKNQFVKIYFIFCKASL